MLKTFILAAALLPASFVAQDWCGTSHKMNQVLDQNPELKAQMHQMATQMSQQTPSMQKINIIIPVAVHILHNNGVGNISNEQVQSALDVLNRDYNRLNSDASSTRQTSTAPFGTYAANVGITFKLAKIDPNGNCTNGIERRNAPGLSVNANDDCKDFNLGGLNAWNNNKYLNIWVVNTINSGGSAGTTLGYAYLPYFNSGTDFGILIRADRMGTIEDAVDEGRTLTHEMGHTLGLSHTFDPGFGGGTSGCHSDDCSNNGDYVCDTPPVNVATFGCSPSSNTCANIPVGDVFGFNALDQIENYMSYDPCQNMFSIGQKNIMLNNISTIPKLISLASAANIAATGVNNTPTFCKADFTSNFTTICVGDSITFSDLSYTQPTEWNWSFSGALQPTSNAQNPTITYTTPGVFAVSLNAGNGSVSDAEIKTAYVRVLGIIGTLPIVEGFEDFTAATFPDNSKWFVDNVTGSSTWALTSTAANSGSKSLKLGNFNQNGNFTDWVSSGVYDLSSVDSAEVVTLSFRYAYRKRTTTDSERLRLLVNANCGTTPWFIRKTLTGGQLSSITQTTAFTPTQNDWVTVHVTNIIFVHFTNEFRMRFEFASDNGNNIYLDDINLYRGQPSSTVVTTSLNESTPNTNSSMSIFPNPVENDLNCEFSVQESQEVTVLVLDASGRIVQSHKINAAIGANLILLDTDKLASGSYTISLIGKSVNSVQQFMKR